MNLTIEDYGTTRVLTLKESRLDAAIAGEFKDEARSAITDESHVMVLDLGEVSFIDSSGIGAIVGVMKQLGRERRMELCSLRPTVLKLFKLTRMDSVFVIHAGRDEAISANVAERKTG